MIGRAQWVGYQSTFEGSSSGAPSTQQVNVNLPVGKMPARCGFGLHERRLGPLFSYIAQASVAYRLSLARGSSISFGATTYYIARGIDYQKYRFAEAGDPLDSENWENDQNFDFAAGFRLQRGAFFASFAMRNLANVQYEYGYGEYLNDSRTLSTSVVQAGYGIVLSGAQDAPELEIIPNLMLQSDLKKHYFLTWWHRGDPAADSGGDQHEHLEAASLFWALTFSGTGRCVWVILLILLSTTRGRRQPPRTRSCSTIGSVQKEDRIPIRNPRFTF